MTIDNKNHLDHYLPEASLVEFTCEKIANVSGVFLNPYMNMTAQECQNYSFAIKDTSSDLIFTGEQKTFLAERYGGSGINKHAGGVRCGYSNGYQVKGIGKNLLAGKGVDYWHSHGTMSLIESLYETLWGEALNRILPFGAVRSPGIIFTKALCWLKPLTGEEQIETPRALMLREPALRPAHFERAYRFNNSVEGQGLIHDTDRTKAAVKMLPDALSRPENISHSQWLECSAVEKLNHGLHELCRRVAAQAARARARRLMHGAPGSSNVCLDGRWLDYDTTSLLSCYANVATGHMQKPFWEEHLRFYYTLDELCFYVAKYYPENDTSLLPQALNLKRFYFAEFESKLLQEFLLLTGFPKAIQQHYWNSPEAPQLAGFLIQLAKSGNDTVISKIPDAETVMGDYDLPQILYQAACSGSQQVMHANLKKLLPTIEIRTAFVDIYTKFTEQIYKHNAACSHQLLRRRVIIRTAKRVKNTDMLFRHRAYEVLHKLVERYPEPSECSEMYRRIFEKTMDQVDILYEEADDNFELVWKKGRVKVHLDCSENQWLITKDNNNVHKIDCESELDDDICLAELIQARSWWGDKVWEKFR